MSKLAVVVLAGALAAPSAAQSARSYLNVRIESKGETYTQEHPGDSLRYEVFGQLDHTHNEGLALFSLDLVYDGGPLQRAKVPLGPPMNNFVSPLGVGNPEGFGGTKSQGDLLQIGGMQNTIKNTFAPQPTGTVITGIGHTEQSLVIGRVRAPTSLGTYHLEVQNLTANVIAEGESGIPFWRCEPAFPGQVVGLTIEVIPLDVPVEPLTAGGGGKLPIRIDAGTENAGKSYWLFGSIVDDGFDGSVRIGDHELPLQDDAYFRHTFGSPNSGAFTNSRGELGADGKAADAVLEIPAEALLPHVGKRLRHVMAIFDGPELTYVSPPVDVEIVD